MKYRITLFEGDGIGPEIIKELKKVFLSLNLNIEYEEFLIGQRALDKYGILIPPEAVESIRRNKIVIKAPVSTPVGTGFKSVNVQLRLLFDLFVNFRPSKTIPGISSRYKDIDIVVFRENTEDLYVGEEHEIEDGFFAKKIITKRNCERIIRYAFDYAQKNNRKKVTCIHKANILKKTDGLFLEVFNEIKQQYPDIESDNKIIDNACMQLVMNPHQFDCIVTTNLYGDIISDLVSGLVGGLGVVPSSNLGNNVAIFEAVHGSAPDIAGRGIANPTAILLSGSLRLDHIGEHDKADLLRASLYKTIANGFLTQDLGGKLTSDEFTNKLIEQINIFQ